MILKIIQIEKYLRKKSVTEFKLKNKRTIFYIKILKIFHLDKSK